ncbi:DUF535 family protein [Luteibacter yeojuensis]|uniref:DUF535 domain-containing protein n=1 Tax=Luteibacter yeojuensis TaxID=345309 RepID=A0A7X5QVZ8_9GAMM|nr:DUF535 family protein [Luteibacter yeojuensis]NID16401.1 DUF535 domain-containing protein [Luteibacter yeojuensis]
MQPRYPHSAPFEEIPLGWAQSRQERGPLALVVDHARRRAALRRSMPVPERRLAYLLRTLTAFRRQAQWLGFVGASRAMRAAAESNPRVYERWQSHYISRSFDMATRARLIEAHYRFVAREFPERISARLLRGHDVRLATLPLGGGEMAYLHARAPEHECTGELGLYLLNGEKEVISSCAITFGGDDGLLVGAMRGSWAYLGRGAIARFTRSSGGLRPRDLLLSVVRALAAHYGIERVRGVAQEAHPLDRRAGVTAAAYDRFWRRHGGVAGADGCYDIPLSAESSAPAQRDVFREEACAVALKTLGKAM